jgi:outer membrane autotransporter protein
VALIASQHAYAQCTSGAPYSGGVIANGVTVTYGNVSAGYADAVVAQNGAIVTTNGSIYGPGGGVCAMTSSTVTVNGSPVTTSYGIGLGAYSGATITANGIMLGSSGQAMVADAATIIANGVSISWSGGNGMPLAEALAGGQIQFTPNSSITTMSGGFGAPMLLATGVGSGITADGLTVSFPNNGITAFGAQGGADIELSNSTIEATSGTGGGNTGLSATGAGSTITATNVVVSLGSGGNDVGVNAGSGGQVMLTGGSVTVPGLGGGETGLQATGSGSLITANDVAVSVTGAGGDAGVKATSGASIGTTDGSVSVVNGAGGLLQNGGSVTMTGADLTASGNGGFGFLFNSGGAANTLQYSNGTIAASDASFSVQGSTANISLTNATAVANNNTLLETTSSGSAAFDAQGSTLQGVITTDATSTSTVNLTQATVWTMTGNSNATSVTNNDSEIIYTPPTGDSTLLSSYKTLTAVNYTGAAGTILLNTYLGTDDSPSDRLIINGGTATGSTTLDIRNTTGPGELTVANGIPVVQAINGGVTEPGAFALAGVVEAGPFEYQLFRGGVSGSDPQDWFLRNTFVVPPTPTPPTPTPPTPTPPTPTPPTPTPPTPTPTPPTPTPPTPTPPTPPVTPPGPSPVDPLPPTPPPQPLPPGGAFPIIGPQLATDGVVQPLARQLGLESLGTLHERVGDTSESDCGDLAPATSTGDLPTKKPGPAAAPFCWPAAWARVFGEQIDNRYQAFADPRASGSLIGVQTGLDLWRGSFWPGHHDAAGLYFAYGNSSTNVDGLVTNSAATAYILTHTGKVNLNAYSGGAYWTHYGPGGWYVDGVVQGTVYTGQATTQYNSLSTNGSGFLASLEAGYPFPLPLALAPRFVLEPQAQMIWQHVGFNQDYDGVQNVALGSTSGWTGRLGLRAQSTVVMDSGQVWQPYVRANVWWDWGARASTTYGESPIQVSLLDQATWLEFAGGGTVKINAQWSFYGQAGYQFAVAPGDVRRNGVTGDFGLRYSW